MEEKFDTLSCWAQIHVENSESPVTNFGGKSAGV
jgi:hypothetical protein